MISEAEFANLVRHFPALRELSDDERQDFLAAARTLVLHDRACAFEAQGPCENFLWLTDGGVRVLADDGRGREILLYRVAPGELCIFTTSCALGHGAYPAEGRAEGEVRAVVLPVARFEDLVVRSAALRRLVFAALSTRLHEVMALVEEVAFRHLEERVVAWILRSARAARAEVLDSSHQELADDLGAAREPVSRVLAALEREGLVALGRRRIEILDGPALGAKLPSSHS